MPSPLQTRRIAILGGGIAGLSAAYELERQRLAGKPVDWYLYEASERFGGTVQTIRYPSPAGDFICEQGPDAWVTEKPWARELVEELGLGGEIIHSNDVTKKTYIWLHGELVPMPDRMRMMVPEDLEVLHGSPLFSAEAKVAYASELERAAELKDSAPGADESVAGFVRRHFGEEVLERIGAPLLSGIFGGDVTRLSVRAVMPGFVRMEAEHGSLVLALQRQRRQRGGKPPEPTFTTLRHGMGSLVDALVASLPKARLQLGTSAVALRRSQTGWLVRFQAAELNHCAVGMVPFDHVLLATPPDVSRHFLQSLDESAAALIPGVASSAVLATFCWPAEFASGFQLPSGFGFLVPRRPSAGPDDPHLLAGTFTDQKFSDRVPSGARMLRVFFGGALADHLNAMPDAHIIHQAWQELGKTLPGLPSPEPCMTTVARWPRSLPQYEVGHPARMDTLQSKIERIGSLHLLGNAYRGVGVPDLIRDGRLAAREIVGHVS